MERRERRTTPPSTRRRSSAEPVNLKRWKFDGPLGEDQYFYTCARPGRSRGRGASVPDDVVSTWIRRLPGNYISIVSLLGCKPGRNGKSEFCHYSFHGGFDTPDAEENGLTFQQWIEEHHPDRNITVHEFPTVDETKAPDAQREDITLCVKELVAAGQTVVIIDSGGVQRTGRVAGYFGANQVALCTSVH